MMSQICDEKLLYNCPCQSVQWCMKRCRLTISSDCVYFTNIHSFIYCFSLFHVPSGGRISNWGDLVRAGHTPDTVNHFTPKLLVTSIIWCNVIIRDYSSGMESELDSMAAMTQNSHHPFLNSLTVWGYDSVISCVCVMNCTVLQHDSSIYTVPRKCAVLRCTSYIIWTLDECPWALCDGLMFSLETWELTLFVFVRFSLIVCVNQV